MYRGSGTGTRIFPIILVLIIIAIAIAALVSVGRMIFNGGDQQMPAVTDISREALLNTSVGRSVRMTVRGPIVADENFRSYRVEANVNSRSLTTYSGYLAQPIDSKTLGNNTRAYDELVHALDKANLAKGTAFTGDKDDTRGVCATGRVYEFEIVNNGETVKRLWTSTCKGSTGSLQASVKQLENLFLQQIPDNRTLLKNIDL